MRGASRLTAVVKATFSLIHEKVAEVTTPVEIVREDQPQNGQASLREASEVAPFLPNAGVLLRGTAYAPAGQAATGRLVRLGLGREKQWLLNKALHVFGDRTREAPSPGVFQRLPLIYERAYGGPHVDANPVGMGAGAALPNIVDPANPSRPAGFGPISRRWAPRKAFAAPAPAPSVGAPDFSSSFDFRSFHAAPEDQQVEFLRGDEWILLEGMHPQLPWVRSSLPSARGVARLYRAASGQVQGQDIELAADMLVIDADRMIGSVVWRGTVSLQAGDSPASLRVLAGVEVMGRALVWPSAEAYFPSAGSVGPRRGEALEKTTQLPSEYGLTSQLPPEYMLPGSVPPLVASPGRSLRSLRVAPIGQTADVDHAKIGPALPFVPASSAPPPSAPAPGSGTTSGPDSKR